MELIPRDPKSGHVLVELTEREFDAFLAFLGAQQIGASQIAMLRDCGFLAPMPRAAGSEWLFTLFKAPADAMAIAVCRDGCREAFDRFIAFQQKERAQAEGSG